MGGEARMGLRCMSENGDWRESCVQPEGINAPMPLVSAQRARCKPESRAHLRACEATYAARERARRAPQA